MKRLLFVRDCQRKIDIFLTFLSMIDQMPKKVVFLDDKRKNVEELEPVLAEMGIRYIAHKHVERVYFPELAAIQYQHLNTILSNEAARLLMQDQTSANE